MIVTIFGISLATVGGGFLLLEKWNFRFKKLMPYLVSISAGMLLALCLVEFLPQSFERGHSNAPLLIIGGILAIILAEKYLVPLMDSQSSCCDPKEHTVGPCISHNAACSSIGCVIICSFFDGLEIVAGFGIDRHAGFLTSVGMAFHVIPEGALVAGLAISGQLRKGLSRWLVTSVGLSVILGAIVGVTLSNTLNFSSTVLPMAAGILIYISVGHLLPVALNLKGGLLGLIIGIGTIFLLSVGHHHHHHH